MSNRWLGQIRGWFHIKILKVFVEPFAWASQEVVPHWALGGVGRGISHTRPLRCKHLEMMIIVIALQVILTILNLEVFVFPDFVKTIY